MKETYYIFSALFALFTIIPLIKHNGWWVRIFEFPRFQIAIFGITILVYASIIYEKSILFISFAFIVFVCLLYQIIKILPYTLFYPVQMHRYKNAPINDSIKILIANVFMHNNNFDRLVEIVNKHTPDILLIIEANESWYKNLNNKINYIHTVAKPLNNTYGMILYSNFELQDSKIEYLVENDVPSIHTKVKLPTGSEIYLHCLHPKPPAPQESTETTERDAELLLVGKRANKHGGATIVAGDLNDVAWSYTTTLFQKISGLLDPRIGRGMFNTFHVKTPFFRFPLDHAFASKHFKLRTINRLHAFGSDHFPIFIELVLDGKAPIQHEPPIAGQDDKQRAEEKIEEGIS